MFWGSQSGTAEGFAARLGRELLQRFHFDALVADISDFDPETIAEIPKSKVAVFIMATYGDGDPSDNATELWDWLQRQQPSERSSRPLASLRYAAFGLGNSHYQYYNRIIAGVDEALQACGAQRLMATGKADDALGTTEEDFIAWKEALFGLFVMELGLEEHEAKYAPVIAVVPDDSLDLSDLYVDEPVPHGGSGSGTRKQSLSSPIRPLPIQRARQLCSPGAPGTVGLKRECFHVEFDLAEEPELRYKTGDHLAIWPTNPEVEVERLLSMLGSSEDAKRRHPLLINTLDPTVKVKVPSPTTLEALLRHHLEICALVSRATMQRLTEFAPTSSAKEFLLNLGRSKEAYAAFTSTTHVNLGRLLEFTLSLGAGSPAEQSGQGNDWSGMPLSFVIEALPRMQPRYYSISSSSIVKPRTPSITVGISDTQLIVESSQSPIVIPGLATNLLKETTTFLGQGTCCLFAQTRRSKFKLPALASTPLLMVAAGTGIAPFRAFIEERLRLQSIGGNKPVGQMVIFFGCQSSETDYLYRDELLEMQRQLGDKLKIVTAFSRPHLDSVAPSQEKQKRKYVQDRIEEHAEEVVGMVLNGASFYVCGRASMAREVGKVLRVSVAKLKGWDAQQVTGWAESMKRNSKWQEDVWG